jgi:hypothetical protein
VRLEGLGQLKNTMISSEIDPAAFRLVALCLEQLLELTNIFFVKYTAIRKHILIVSTCPRFIIN